MSKKQKKKLFAVFLAIIAIAASYFGAQFSDKNTDTVEYSKGEDILAVNYLDVGQGDCEFIELPQDKCMLIDSGEAEYSDQVITKIKQLGYNRIDYVVATHPHSDHIGAMSSIISEFEIGEIYMPRATATTRTYERLLDTISDKGLKIHSAKAGKNIYKDDKLSIDILSPAEDSYDNLNNYSAVVKIKYGLSSFLFTGDAESEVEEEMINNYYSMLSSDVLKVGHHGSKYSSSSDFIDAVSPEYAVISCGEDNSYGHPHEQALNRIIESTNNIFRTDMYSDIRFETNGDGTYAYTFNCFDKLAAVKE